MNHVLPNLMRLLMALCLAGYGTFSMAGVSGDSGSFFMEICADGVALTVLVDADGQPVESEETCPDCHACCFLSSFGPPQVSAQLLVPIHVEINAERPAFATPVFQKRNILPVPRGPPAMFIVISAKSDLIRTDRADIADTTRSDGRPLSKDASA